MSVSHENFFDFLDLDISTTAIDFRLIKQGVSDLQLYSPAHDKKHTVIVKLDEPRITRFF